MVNLKEYQEKLEEIYQYASENDIAKTEVDKVFYNSFCILQKKHKKFSIRFCVKSILIALCAIITCFVYFDKKFLVVILLRNLQSSIYPGLKLVRNIAVPIIQHYPSLTELYDEWCILENPYFYVNDMDCWPCSVIQFIPDLTGHQISRSLNPGIPYTKTENISKVYMENVQKLLLQNSKIFEQDAAKIFSNNLTYRNILDVMETNMGLYPSQNLNTHIIWRVNRMTAGRILRKLFPKPADTPNWWEQSTEKFIFFDEPKSSSYPLPNPECSNVMIRCTSGTRLIRMIATPECITSCMSYTVLLSAGKTLWYNWWYWRPVSLPALNSTTITISYMTSFC